MKKLSLILAALLLMSSFAACSEKPTGNDGDVTTASQGNVNAEIEAETDMLDARKNLKDNLPEADFDGAKFRIYGESETVAKNFYAETATGDVVNDAIYNAIRATEERFDTDIVIVYSNAENTFAYSDAIQNVILTQDDIFDVAEHHDTLSASQSLLGYYVNLYELDRLDFTQPWWTPNTIESMTFMDQLYLGSSAMSITGFNQTRVIYFNKQLLKDRNMEEPYQTVLEGNWYLDTLINQTKDVYEDLNGDSVKDDGDFYGYIAEAPIFCYCESYGIPTVTKTDTKLSMNMNNERTITMVDKLYSFYFETKGGTITGYKNIGDASWNTTNNTELFENGQALYTFGEISDAVNILRYGDVEYGIIPTPKLDESQEDYYAAYTDRFVVVPQTLPTDRYDFVGTILESMCIEGYKQVFPAYYEIALKQKLTNDDESVQVLDLINNCRVLDFGYIYCDGTGILQDCLSGSNPSRNFVSAYEAKEKSLNTKLRVVTKAFQKMQEN